MCVFRMGGEVGRVARGCPELDSQRERERERVRERDSTRCKEACVTPSLPVPAGA